MQSTCASSSSGSRCTFRGRHGVLRAQYDDDSEEPGTVWSYKPRRGKFEVRFPLHAACEKVALTWAELFGESPCMESESGVARLVQPRSGQVLTPQPAGRVPRNGDAECCQRIETASQSGEPPCPHLRMIMCRSQSVVLPADGERDQVDQVVAWQYFRRHTLDRRHTL